MHVCSCMLMCVCVYWWRGDGDALKCVSQASSRSRLKSVAEDLQAWRYESVCGKYRGHGPALRHIPASEGVQGRSAVPQYLITQHTGPQGPLSSTTHTCVHTHTHIPYIHIKSYCDRTFSEYIMGSNSWIRNTCDTYLLQVNIIRAIYGAKPTN